MTRLRLLPALIVLTAAMGTAVRADAQPLGTFSWQLQPYCNVITVNVNQQGAVYTMDGYDDQCGAGQRAPLVGTATPNPDGTIGLGLNVVTVPGGRGVQIDARITLAGLGGPWTDSAGNSGTFAFGANTGGSPRPAVSGGSTIPSTFALLNDGGFLARGTFGTGDIPASNAGTRMMWHPAKAAFRAGRVTIPVWDDVNIGLYSAAFGLNTLAAGAYSFATGQESAALGMSSTAFGEATQASGAQSSAFGRSTVASGAQSLAFGLNATASGLNSVALSRNTTALGNYSLAAGYYTSATGLASAAFGSNTIAAGPSSIASGYQAFTNGAYSAALGLNVNAGGGGSIVLGSYATALAAAYGTFIFGDQSTSTPVVGYAPNQFIVRAVGGTGFYTNTAANVGVELAPGGGGWSVVSDVNVKEHFRDWAAEDVLSGIARMPVREWNYKTQDASIRHMGPTAQDFHAAFGLGESNLRINTIDADGVALAAVKALEMRTRELNERLTRENDELRARLARLESLLDKR